MRREFFINISILFVLNALIKPLYVLGIELPVQNIVGTEKYGLYFTLISFIYFFQFLNDFGINHLIRKNISEQREAIFKDFPIILTTRCLMCLFFIVAVMGINYLVGYEIDNVLLLLIISINFALATLIQTYRSGLAALGRYRSDSFLSALDKLLLIAFLCPFIFMSVLKSHFSIYTFVYCQFASLLVTLIISMLIFYRNFALALFRFSIVEIRSFLRLSLPFACMIFFMSVYSRIDGFMLRELLPNGLYEAGSYAAAFRLYDAANMFAILMGTLLLPMSSYLLSNKENLDQLLNSALRLMIMITLGAGLLTYFYCEEIMSLLYDDYSHGWGEILKWLMMGYIPLGFTHIFGVLLIADNKIKWLNAVYFGGLLLNITLNLWLIPSYHAIGASVATAVTQFFVLILQVYIFSKHRQMNISRNMELLGFITLTVLMSYLIYHFIKYEWGLKFVISSIGIVFVGLLTNMLPIRDLLKIVLSKL